MHRSCACVAHDRRRVCITLGLEEGACRFYAGLEVGDAELQCSLGHGDDED